MGRVAAAVAAAAVLLAATACGERAEPTGPSVQLYPLTVVDAEGRAITLTARPERIVVLDDAAAQIVRGLGRTVTGEPLLPTGTVDLTALARLHPDLVVATESGGEPDLSQVPRATQAPLYVAPGDSLHGVEHAITQLGLLLGRPLDSRKLVASIETDRRRVETAVAGEPVVSVFLDTGFFTTVSDQSLAGDLIRLARGTNVAGSSPADGPFDLAELAQANPEVYLAASDASVTLADLRADPRTKRLRAVRTGRFGVVDSSLLEPSPRIGEALIAIARALHPHALR